MATKWDLYGRNFSQNGNTKRERIISTTQGLTHRLSLDSHLYKECERDGSTIYLDIVARDNLTEKTIYTMPNCNSDYKLGDIIVWSNRKWLVSEVDADDELDRRGIMSECNHLFRWQNPGSTTVHEVWGIITRPYSRFSGGDGKVLEFPYAQLRFTIPYNEETKHWYKGKRMGVERGYDSEGKEILVSYECIMIESVTSDFGNGHLLIVEGQLTEWTQNDSVTEMIADYVAPAASSTVISGPTYIRAGGADGVYAASSYAVPVWSVDLPTGYSALFTTSEPGDGTFHISAASDNDGVIGQTLTVHASYNGAESTMDVEVRSIYG